MASRRHSLAREGNESKTCPVCGSIPDHHTYAGYGSRGYGMNQGGRTCYQCFDVWDVLQHKARRLRRLVALTFIASGLVAIAGGGWWLYLDAHFILNPFAAMSCVLLIIAIALLVSWRRHDRKSYDLWRRLHSAGLNYPYASQPRLSGY
jgi:hypothetical protein